MGPDGMSLVNGTTGVHGDDYWNEGGVSQGRPPSPPNQSQPQSQPQRQVSDVYSNTLPVRRPQPAKNKTTVGKRNQPFHSTSWANKVLFDFEKSSIKGIMEGIIVNSWFAL